MSNTIDSNNDMSVFIKLTPIEIKNLMRDFADKYHNAKSNNEDTNIRNLCDFYYYLSMSILESTDPDRFIHNS